MITIRQPNKCGLCGAEWYDTHVCPRENDRIWGAGNWVQCQTCSLDDMGNYIFHHKDAHTTSTERSSRHIVCQVRIHTHTAPDMQGQGMSVHCPAVFLPNDGKWLPGNLVEVKLLGAVPQRQDSLLDQLNDLLTYATNFGMYDAVDWIKERLDDTNK